ncbi:hypothetical protein [Spiroplasma endosymbiont of Labia minor]|uniref:hypothetical protein n=1 Tax=Spiroplasma endosymbiont of Labia minor TaxID=3066305 RepID=UPI0030CAC561
MVLKTYENIVNKIVTDWFKKSLDDKESAFNIPQKEIFDSQNSSVKRILNEINHANTIDEIENIMHSIRVSSSFTNVLNSNNNFLNIVEDIMNESTDLTEDENKLNPSVIILYSLLEKKMNSLTFTSETIKKIGANETPSRQMLDDLKWLFYQKISSNLDKVISYQNINKMYDKDIEQIKWIKNDSPSFDESYEMLNRIYKKIDIKLINSNDSANLIDIISQTASLSKVKNILLSKKIQNTIIFLNLMEESVSYLKLANLIYKEIERNI